MRDYYKNMIYRNNPHGVTGFQVNRAAAKLEAEYPYSVKLNYWENWSPDNKRDPRKVFCYDCQMTGFASLETIGGVRYFFKREEDLSFFLIRWGNECVAQQ